MRIQVNHYSMSYTDAGEGRPLLLIHGYPLNRKLWQPQMKGLAGVARVLAPDLRGHGDSQAVTGAYPMNLLAEDINAFLDGLKISTPVVVCGLSMGGYVTFAFYRKYARRVAGLILTSTRAGADMPEARIARDLAMSTAKEKGLMAIFDGMAPRLLSPGNYQSRSDLVEKVRAIMERTSLEGVLGDLVGMRDRLDSTPTLRQINVPVLVIHGAEDALIPLREAQAMAETIPGARLEIIPGAGHLPNLENPRVFNRVVRNFLMDL
jgi:3-oxoadipate enol-lactonase